MSGSGNVLEGVPLLGRASSTLEGGVCEWTAKLRDRPVVYLVTYGPEGFTQTPPSGVWRGVRSSGGDGLWTSSLVSFGRGDAHGGSKR